MSCTLYFKDKLKLIYAKMSELCIAGAAIVDPL